MNKFDYDFENIDNKEMTNKLFCTFTVEEELDSLLETITSKYNIVYNKIFVLYSKL